MNEKPKNGKVQKKRGSRFFSGSLPFFGEGVKQNKRQTKKKPPKQNKPFWEKGGCEL
jgi:hypothetical protein